MPAGTVERMMVQGLTAEAVAAHASAQAWLELTPILLSAAAEAPSGTLLPEFFMQVCLPSLSCFDRPCTIHLLFGLVCSVYLSHWTSCTSSLIVQDLAAIDLASKVERAGSVCSSQPPAWGHCAQLCDENELC